ncbi:MAG: GIY-YIG nuclease family protein [Armatimonadetes bacterium]|nr:GIY-YIG nuclease family protein [Armatimonadota bacterium]NIM23226.1 GIY-YIG nuclease family protein [Armatimonadota bacterium]NIM67094.1 GIY-YIG nuclease family protein [Armatimonadota bacterium]NIM75621.1 GIY-YIG nuclease family protein [Armatimonadota bacterium]NIN05283.1 GIY-YIG nuclease family protein [Armatimonadota bacterium]
MQYVYLLQSCSNPSKRYIGKTKDLEQRLAAHNAGKSPHTAPHIPWKIVVAVYFADDSKASVFECYLKQGTGHHLGIGPATRPRKLEEETAYSVTKQTETEE